MPSEPARYWGSICLGIVTIGTAAIGVALFSSDLVDGQIPEGGSVPVILFIVKIGSAVLANFFYLAVLYRAGRLIVSASEKLPRNSAATAKRVSWVYALFFCELLALLILLVADLALNFLAQTALPSEPAALLFTP